MAKRDHTLLGEIESDLLSGKPLADVLRKVIVLGGRAGSGAMRDWASLELNGYADSSEQIPPYRGVPALIQLDGIIGFNQIKGQTVAPTDLPDFVREDIKEYVELPFGVGELEAIVREHDADKPLRLSLPLAADLARLLSGSLPNQQITALYWAVSPSSVRGVLDKIRTKLAELVGELSATMPTTQETPSAEQATQAIQFVQTGRRSTITVANAQATSGGTSTVTQAVEPSTDSEPAWWTLSRKIGAFIVGCAIIAGALYSHRASLVRPGARSRRHGGGLLHHP